MSSSLGENSLPVGATAPEHVMLKRGVTTETRQVLGNVGNAVATLNQQLQMKKDHLMQELRKEKSQVEKQLSGKPSATVAPSASLGDFCIYTDSPKSKDEVGESQANRFSGQSVSMEDSENLPPRFNEHAAPSFAPPVAKVAPMQQLQKIPSVEEQRTPFAEILPSQEQNELLTFRDRMFDVPDYQTDILEYLKEAEVRFRPKSDYMRKQPDINGNMRTVLVDWIVEVCEEYRLNTETLYLAVSYVDRFLSLMSVVRSKLQLVGTSAMFIAAKLEEIYPPDVADFVYITDDTYNKKQVLRMEQLILRALSFDMSAPTPHVFLNLFCVMGNLPDSVRFLAMYLCELSLLYYTPFLQYLPSRVAAAALAYARLLENHEGRMWTRDMELITGYELGHLQQVICELGAVHEKNPQMVQKAIPEKYKAQKYLGVALIEAVELTEQIFKDTYASIEKELEDVVRGI